MTFIKGGDNFYMTREQIGAALEYKDPQNGIDVLHGRHKDRLEHFSVPVSLRATDGKIYDTIVYNRKGVFKICRWSRQPKANAFMDWAWDILDGLITGRYKLELRRLEDKLDLREMYLDNREENLNEREYLVKLGETYLDEKKKIDQIRFAKKRGKYSISDILRIIDMYECNKMQHNVIDKADKVCYNNKNKG